MHYREFQPRRSANSIELFWRLDFPETGIGDVQRIVPDGRTELIINLGLPFERCEDGVWLRQPECFYIGQIASSVLVRPNGPASMIGIRFRPCGARRIFRTPMRELAGQTVSLGELSPTLAKQIDRVRELRSPEEQARFLDSLFSAMDRPLPLSRTLSHITEAASETGTPFRISDLAAQAGWSVRQLERRFLDETGLSPKLFCRIQRFQAVFRCKSDGTTWAEAALHCGYFDQAHLIRDFRDFSGEAPESLLSRDSGLAWHFIQRDALSHFSNTIDHNDLYTL